MNIRNLIHRLVHDSVGGLPRVLEAFNYGRKNQMSMQLLTNKLNPNSETHTTNVQEFELLGDTLNVNLQISEYFATKCNAVVFVLPDVDEGDMAILDGFMQMTKELGDVGMKFQLAYADGSLDKTDVKVIRKEIKELVASALAFDKRIEGMQHGR